MKIQKNIGDNFYITDRKNNYLEILFCCAQDNLRIAYRVDDPLSISELIQQSDGKIKNVFTLLSNPAQEIIEFDDKDTEEVKILVLLAGFEWCE